MGEINQTNEMNGNNQSGNVVLQDPNPLNDKGLNKCNKVIAQS